MKSKLENYICQEGIKDMKKLRLNHGYALVDDEVYELVTCYKWYINTVNSRQYIVRNEKINSFKYNKVLLHRWVYEHYHKTLPPRIHLRFRDGNSMNCTKDNIYVATRENK